MLNLKDERPTFNAQRPTSNQKIIRQNQVFIIYLFPSAVLCLCQYLYLILSFDVQRWTFDVRRSFFLLFHSSFDVQRSIRLRPAMQDYDSTRVGCSSFFGN